MIFSTLNTGIVAIINEKQHIEGTGFLVSKNLVVTCAHVIECASKAPGQEVQIQFRASKQTMTAMVEPAYWKPPDQEDIAFLRLLQDKPEQEEILLLGSSSGTSGHPFETLGFPASLDEARGYGIIGGLVTLVNRKLLQLTGTTEITKGFSGAPLLNIQTRRVIGMVAAIAKPDAFGKFTETAFIIPSEVLREICKEIQLSDISPYRSLEIFTEKDAEFFFGREHFINELLKNLRQEPRFLAVLGPSGSGKSSVIQAGLIPKLKQGEIPGSDKWTILESTRPTTLLIEGFEAFQKRIYEQTANNHTLLVIDQFEEFLIAGDGTTSQVFLDYFVQMLKGNFDISFVIAMRSDFQALLADKADELAKWVDRCLLRIPPYLSIEELRQIIQKPAEVVKIKFEPGLVNDLIEDILNETATTSLKEKVGRSTVLPLLEFTLKELWDRRNDGFLTQETYRKLAGVAGSLTQWANKTYYALEPDMRLIARRIFTDLIYLGNDELNIPDSRRRRSLTALVSNEQEYEIVRHVIEHLSHPEHRLIITFYEVDQEYVELIHDALLREWKLFQEWLREDREFLVWRQAIESRAIGWIKEGKQDTGKLLGGGDLSAALDWENKKGTVLSNELLEFINSSKDHETSEREKELDRARKLANTQRQRSFALTIGLIIAVILSMIAFSFFLQSNSNLGNANTANTQSSINLQSANIANTQSFVNLQNANLANTQAINNLSEAQNNAATAQVANTQSAINLNIANSNEATAIAERNVALTGELSAQALIQLQQKDDLAMLLSIEAYSSSKSSQSYQALYTIWKYNPKLIQIIQGHQGTVWSVAINPNGKILATGTAEGIVQLWNVDVLSSSSFGQPLGKPLIGYKNSSALSVAFSPDGTILASGSADSAIRLWNVDVSSPSFAQQIGDPLTGHYGPVWYVVFSPDGKMLASGSVDKTVRLWNVDIDSPTFGQQLITPLTGHRDVVRSVAFNTSGTILASGSADNTIRLWNVDVSSPSFGQTFGKPLAEHTDWILSVTFSPDGEMLASGSQDKTVRLWDVNINSPSFGKQLGKPLIAHQDLVRSVVFAPEGTILASGSDDSTIRFWDVDIGSPSFGQTLGEPVTGHQGIGKVLSVLFSPDGSTLASGSTDGSIRLWEFENSLSIMRKSLVGKSLTGHTDAVLNIAFSPNGTILASGSADNTIRLWNVDVSSPSFGQMLGTPLVGHQDLVWGIAFSPSGMILASGSVDGTIRLWNVDVSSPSFGHPLGEPLLGHTDSVLSVAFNPDETILASGSADNTIRFWNVVIGSPSFGQHVEEPLAGHQETVWTVKFSPDGMILASGSVDSTIRLWNVDVDSSSFGQPVGEPLTGHTARVLSVAFDPSGKMLASGSEDRTIRLWDVDVSSPTFGQQLGEPLIANDRIASSVAFNPDGNMLASGFSDATIWLWDIQSRKLLGEALIGHTDTILIVAFSPNGGILGSGSEDDTIRLWDLTPETWISSICQRVGRNLTEAEWNQYLSWRGPFDPTYKTCPQWPADPNYLDLILQEGEELVHNGELAQAIIKFKEALSLEPALGFDPETHVNELANEYKNENFSNNLIAQGRVLAIEGKIDEALDNFKQAQELFPETDISASSWNELCWWGSLWKRARDVLTACDQAVALSPADGSIRDSRGVARALTGDFEGAIEDFQYTITWAKNANISEEIISIREAWIAALESGQNPFTDEVLEELKNEYPSPPNP